MEATKATYTIEVHPMPKWNPMREFGYRWEWQCSCGSARGGATTKAEAAASGRAHIERDHNVCRDCDVSITASHLVCEQCANP